MREKESLRRLRVEITSLPLVNQMYLILWLCVVYSVSITTITAFSYYVLWFGGVNWRGMVYD